MKPTQGITHFFRLGGIPQNAVAPRLRNEAQGTPEITFIVDPEAGAGASGPNVGKSQIADAVAAGLALPHMVQQDPKVLHDQAGLRENPAVDALENEPRPARLGGGNQKGIVD